MVEKRTDIKSILVIGSGPIIIGQGCEFDYSGTQACRALKEEGYKVSLINTNPATIMTDPDIADATYIEPILPEVIEKIIVQENIDSILPTVGGQTALNCAITLSDQGILDKYNVKLIGANRESIKKAEDRNLFRQAMNKIGLKCPKSFVIHSYEQIKDALNYIGLPAIIRSSFTLGGLGSGIAYNKEEFYRMVNNSLEISPIAEVQVDESIIGWKEFEMEVMRDRKDNCIIVCSIENIDPMGVHTGDSITVAPALTLRDKEYQKMRDASFAVLREMGVDTGGSNVQFAINPNEEDSLVVIEMNPRVSRSSALASKATGFPIAKVAAKLAVGYTLNEIYNDCNISIPASFEPSLDYIVVKIPRFNFDKFPGASKELSTSMKSVGEVMAIGRSFPEAFQKSLCSLETGITGLNEHLPQNTDLNYLKSLLANLSPDRIFIIADAMRHGMSIDLINQITKYDKWFLKYIEDIIHCEEKIKQYGLPKEKIEFLKLKKMGFSDERLAQLTNNDIEVIENLRNELNIKPVYKRIDTCAAEFIAETSYMYSCYEGDAINEPECEANVSNRNKVIIIGSGPNRIGQGIEFDYTCVHAAYVLKNMGYESIMINCNPETVSTDYNTSDRLYFSPLTRENILEIIYKEQENGNLIGVIVQLGGQTPLKLAKVLEDKKIKILGTSFESIDLAEDREKFQQLLIQLNLKQPANVICNSIGEVVEKARSIGFPLVVRPSYVLGGQYMSIIYNEQELEYYLKNHDKIFEYHALLLDQFLTKAVEVDVDAVCDGKNVYIAGIIEHIEEAGIHSGDSACSLPPYTLGKNIIDDIIEQTKKIALSLKVIGLINIQYAIKNQNVYILEVNPRASRTLPFVAKATGISLAKLATKVIMGGEIGEIEVKKFNHVAVKEAVFSFSRFPNVDILLGPEMKSTGEVMGVDSSFEMAFVKAQMAAGYQLPIVGTALISVEDQDKESVIDIAKELHDIGFNLYATIGTFTFLSKLEIKINCINKVSEGRPHIIDMLQDRKIDLVINTSKEIEASSDSASIRKATLTLGIPYSTTIAGAKALVRAIKILKNQGLEVTSMQNYFD